MKGEFIQPEINQKTNDIGKQKILYEQGKIR
jgi:hypothetical protein